MKAPTSRADTNLGRSRQHLHLLSQTCSGSRVVAIAASTMPVGFLGRVDITTSSLSHSVSSLTAFSSALIASNQGSCALILPSPLSFGDITLVDVLGFARHTTGYLPLSPLQLWHNHRTSAEIDPSPPPRSAFSYQATFGAANSPLVLSFGSALMTARLS